MRYRTLAPDVAASDIPRHAEAVGKLEDLVGFYIEDRRPTPRVHRCR